MAESNRRLPSPGYGTINTEMIGRWLSLDPADDGPFWALNLMRYREVAQYEAEDGDPGTGDASTAGATPRSGRDADDEYAPLGPLAAIGAQVVFHGDVVDQPSGTPEWHRVAIVRYPTRAAFFAMQQRDDFRSKHVHKEAGMEFTIVMSCLPTSADDVAAATVTDAGTDSGTVTLVVELDGGDGDNGKLMTAPPAGTIASFDVEGVIIGDERRWRRAHVVVGDAALEVAADAGHQVTRIAAGTRRLVSSIHEMGTPSPTTSEGDPS